MSNHFLLETVWVMFTYGWPYLTYGLAISLMLVIWGSRCARRGSRMAVLAAATLCLWIALFIAADSGYCAWQSIPNPPEEAFSDTGPIFFLLAGWLPGLIVLGIVHLLLRRRRRITPPPPGQ